MLTGVLCLSIHCTAASERKQGLPCLSNGGASFVDQLARWTAGLAVSRVPPIILGSIAHAMGVVFIILAVLVDPWLSDARS